VHRACPAASGSTPIARPAASENRCAVTGARYAQPSHRRSSENRSGRRLCQKARAQFRVAPLERADTVTLNLAGERHLLGDLVRDVGLISTTVRSSASLSPDGDPGFATARGTRVARTPRRPRHPMRSKILVLAVSPRRVLGRAPGRAAAQSRRTPRPGGRLHELQGSSGWCAPIALATSSDSRAALDAAPITACEPSILVVSALRCRAYSGRAPRELLGEPSAPPSSRRVRRLDRMPPLV